MRYQARNVALENQSEQASTTGASTQAPSSGSRTTNQSQGSQGTQKPVIRMVSMYHMGDQPTRFPEEFDISEDSEEVEIEYFGRVLRVIGEVQEERRDVPAPRVNTNKTDCRWCFIVTSSCKTEIHAECWSLGSFLLRVFSQVWGLFSFTSHASRTSRCVR